ncbi:hypothetical protein JRQ81_011133 [Phrynocephalus forsythii]|uniref:SH2 domain-containing protein n=1 Tax=Phrynocephalus forsythii TaxID=171643 RepID=A0A9Q1ARC2_9SAUR|nr:hypothetical protein JRQ81_011133 [Phrynocephalus forsythii]
MSDSSRSALNYASHLPWDVSIIRPHGSGPEEETEKEDQYTYEAPPNEAQSKRIPATKQQEAVEDTYMAAPLLPLKYDKAAKSPRSKEEESCGEPIYLECEPSTGDLVSHLSSFHPKTLFPSSLFATQSSSLSTANTSSLSCEATQYSDMENKPWYAGSCDRQTAEATLRRFNKDSAYLVRRSSRHSWNQPFTLAVLYKNHVYNIPIRYLEGTCQYILGKDGKAHEELFDSIPSIIQNYTERPLVLIDGNTSAKEQTYLLFPVKP